MFSSSHMPLEALLFARAAHSGQTRKHTNQHYIDHPIEVAGLVAVATSHWKCNSIPLCVSLLHDVLEDCDVTYQMLLNRFGVHVASGVLMLTDTEVGNRAQRKAAANERLSKAPSWIQTIKVCDVISNISTIKKFDPTFYRVYSSEKHVQLLAMSKADPRLVKLARSLLG